MRKAPEPIDVPGRSHAKGKGRPYQSALNQAQSQPDVILRSFGLKANPCMTNPPSFSGEALPQP